MRLLKRGGNGALNLTGDLPDQDIPEYVALSHTWGTAAQEVALQDFQSRSTKRRTGATNLCTMGWQTVHSTDAT
jgi:hypothetical protein